MPRSNNANSSADRLKAFFEACEGIAIANIDDFRASFIGAALYFLTDEETDSCIKMAQRMNNVRREKQTSEINKANG